MVKIVQILCYEPNLRHLSKPVPTNFVPLASPKRSVITAISSHRKWLLPGSPNGNKTSLWMLITNDQLGIRHWLQAQESGGHLINCYWFSFGCINNLICWSWREINYLRTFQLPSSSLSNMALFFLSQLVSFHHSWSGLLTYTMPPLIVYFNGVMNSNATRCAPGDGCSKIPQVTTE